jgi:hypothetical protein
MIWRPVAPGAYPGRHLPGSRLRPWTGPRGRFYCKRGYMVQTLQLPLASNRRVILGDGSMVVLDLDLATVLWDMQPREVLVLEAEGGPLMGMAMLYGS